MSYEINEDRTFCNECCLLLTIIIFYTLLTSIYHVDIDENNLDYWDKRHGLDQCCIRDDRGIIRNRETNEVEWKRIALDKNPYWSDVVWDNMYED